ncbi:F0F1 ATP synthase subunit delta [Candidatus Daviesbacteria bacterium]|nr:F0F1 ATP synthase subunit delta [Candidatus Daviesbacteria bacterium]
MKRNKTLEKIARELAEGSFADNKLIEREVIRSIKVLKNLPASQAIFAMSEYLKGIKRKERNHTLYIEAAIPLSPDQIKKAKEIVERKFSITKVLVNINPEILGGFKIKIGDEVWDESLAVKIKQVKEAIQR